MKVEAVEVSIGTLTAKRQPLEDQIDAVLDTHRLRPDNPPHLPTEEAAAQMRVVVCGSPDRCARR